MLHALGVDGLKFTMTSHIAQSGSAHSAHHSGSGSNGYKMQPQPLDIRLQVYYCKVLATIRSLTETIIEVNSP